MKGIILFGILFIVIAVLSDYFMKQKFNIDKKRNDMSDSAKRFQKIIINSTLILFIASMFLISAKYDNFNLLILLIPYFLVLTTFRAIMEFLYNRRANMWLSEMLSLVLFFTYLIMLNMFGYI